MSAEDLGPGAAFSCFSTWGKSSDVYWIDPDGSLLSYYGPLGLKRFAIRQVIYILFRAQYQQLIYNSL